MAGPVGRIGRSLCAMPASITASAWLRLQPTRGAPTRSAWAPRRLWARSTTSPQIPATAHPPCTSPVACSCKDLGSGSIVRTWCCRTVVLRKVAAGQWYAVADPGWYLLENWTGFGKTVLFGEYARGDNLQRTFSPVLSRPRCANWWRHRWPGPSPLPILTTTTPCGAWASCRTSMRRRWKFTSTGGVMRLTAMPCRGPM